MSVAITDDVFMEMVEPLRGELTAHCYRLLGSAHEAEDQVQETYIRAWRAYDRFENRSSVRTWMYRIATNVCLTALDGRKRRPMPTGLGQPSADPRGDLDHRPEVSWLEPLPDAVVWGDAAPDPAAEVVGREDVRLAFVAALQFLTPPQRAAIILFEVLNWSAAEIADLLQTSVPAVNSSLQRARARLRTLDPQTEVRAPDDPRNQAFLDEYAAAFERYDVDRIVELLAEDAVWEMPPFAGWYSGRESIAELIRRHCPAEAPGDQLMVPTRANGQPAFGLYMRQPDGSYTPFQLQVLTLTEAGVEHVGCFFDTDLFPRFGLPASL